MDTIIVQSQEDVPTLTQLQRDAIAEWGGIKDKEGSLVKKISEAGVKYYNCQAGSAESPEMYKSVREAVISTFSAKELALLTPSTAEMKSWPAHKKKHREQVQQKIGSRLGDLRKALQLLQDPSTGNGKGKKAKKSKVQLVIEARDNLQKRIVETPTDQHNWDMKKIEKLLAQIETELKK